MEREAREPRQRLQGGDVSLPVVDGTSRVVHGLHIVGEERRDRAGVLRGDRRLQTSGVSGRGVRSHPATPGAGESGHGGWCRRELVEARECLRLPSDVEELDARQKTTGSENPEPEEGAFEGTATGAIDSGGHPSYEQRVGAQREDVVDASGEAVGDLEHGAHELEDGLRSVRRWEPQRPAIDVCDLWREPRGIAIEVERSEDSRGRARRRRGAGTLAALAEKVGVTLIQAGYGVAEPVARKV